MDETLINQLVQLMREHPEAYQKVAREKPELVRPVMLMVRGEQARQFTADGYKAYYYCLFNRELPKHTYPWVEAFFEEWNSDKKPRGLMVKGFRGSSKSTVTASLGTFITSHFPVRSGMIVQKNDDDAKGMAAFVADVFEFNPGQRACFPNIVPDKERGWGVESGYHINNTAVDHGKWVQMQMEDHGRDPSIIVASAKSGAVGKHPSGWLLLDDIHDYKNVSSKAEMAHVVNTVKSDILPTLIRSGQQPMVLWAYTPWDEEDAYAQMERAGMFRKVSTPAFREDAEGPDAFDGKRGFLAWPEVMGVKELENWRNTLGTREFERMLMCSLENARSGRIMHYSFSSELISYDWPMVGGVDPTNVEKPVGSDGQRSHFALAYVARIPQGGAVIMDGVLTQCSQLEAENYILQAQTRFPFYRYTAVENVGGGAGFIQAVRRNSKLRIVASDLSPMDLDTKKVRDKKSRIEKEIGPWLENGTVRISDAATPFLDALRRGLNQFYDLPKTDYAFDAWDAVYHALKMMPEVLTIAPIGAELPRTRKGKKNNSPLRGIGAYA